MAWIWSDDLAKAAEAAGVAHAELAAWKHRPVAFAAGSDRPTPALARLLLGLEPVDAPDEEQPLEICDCRRVGADAMLGSRPPDG